MPANTPSDFSKLLHKIHGSPIEDIVLERALKCLAQKIVKLPDPAKKVRALYLMEQLLEILTRRSMGFCALPVFSVRHRGRAPVIVC